MGRLVDQSIPTLFNGVSRQPDIVRLASQVQEGEDSLFSVVTGGFEKRPPTQLVGTDLGLDTTKEWHVHIIDRDALEQYAVCINEDGAVEIFLLTDGSAATVNAISAPITTYLTSTDPINDLAVVTIEDYTFIVNRTIEVATKAYAAGTYISDVADIASLPGSPTTNDIHKIVGDATALDDYFVRWDGAFWVETHDPDVNNALDETTMPHALVRQSNGTWTAQTIAWDNREVGDDDTVGHPKFVGKFIQDVFKHKDRLGFIASTQTTLGTTGDLFNFYPKRATTQIDTDPVDRSAGTNKPVTLRWALPIRKTLWMTSESAQFEMTSSNALTPSDASVDPSTTYRCSILARPVAMGDELYFSSEAPSKSQVFEYLFDDAVTSTTATDITQHVDDYIPGDITFLSAIPAEGTLFVYSTGATGSLYVYRTFWDADKKVQSAWSRWNPGFDKVYGMGNAQGELYMVTKRGTKTFIEKLGASRSANVSGLTFSPLIDMRTTVTGSYNSGTDTTSWALPYNHDDEAEIVLSSGFSTAPGKRLVNLTYNVDGVTVEATGDFSASSAYTGLPYTMDVELSNQYLKNDQGSSIIEGRLQLKRMTLAYTDTVTFNVQKTPKARTARNYKMVGRVLGDITAQVGALALGDGNFSFPVKSDASTVQINIQNDTPYPSVITSASWIGLFNEITRQDAAER